MKTILARNIKFIREYHGLTQSQFAAKIDATRSMVLSYERADAEPKDILINKIAEFGQISTDELFNFSLDVNKYKGIIEANSTNKNSTSLSEKQLRLECLKLAVQLKTGEDWCSSDITKLADEFVKWVNGEAE